MYIHSPTAEPELHTGRFDTAVSMTGTSTVQDHFATLPVLTATPAYQPPNEEELHTSFEQAISDRLLVVNKQLSLKSGPLAHSQPLRLNTQSLSYLCQLGQISHPHAMTNVTLTTASIQQYSGQLLPALVGNVWQRSIIFASLILMFMLLGFDLMGLLVLHMH